MNAEQRYKTFARSVCEVLNKDESDDSLKIIEIEALADDAGFAIATDETRCDGGRPEYGITE